MPAAIVGPIAGAVVGGLMSDGGSQTASKEPWSAAAPWLKRNIQQGQDLQAYYQQNPFNRQQMVGYQNLFSDIDNYRNAVSPGLLAITNKYLGKGGSPGISLLSSGAPGKADAGGYAPMSKSFGLLDFNALNPYNGALKPEEIKQPTQQTIEEAIQAELERRQRESSARDGRFA